MSNQPLTATAGHRLAASLAAAALLAGCGSGARPGSATRQVGTPAQSTSIPPTLLAGARPIGAGPRFEPPLRTERVAGCAAPLGRRLRAHVEIFAQNRVVLLATGIGTRPPRRVTDGRLDTAACFGEVVTLDPTGTVYFRPNRTVTLTTLFAEWGQRLSAARIASFTGGAVRAYLDGRAWTGPLGTLRLTPGAEIVLEIGPYVPPHHSFTFPAPPSARLR